jgi:hypothetical protein
MYVLSLIPYILCLFSSPLTPTPSHQISEPLPECDSAAHIPGPLYSGGAGQGYSYYSRYVGSYSK